MPGNINANSIITQSVIVASIPPVLGDYWDSVNYYVDDADNYYEDDIA